MASEGGGKIRNKRGHPTNKPYERRKSLFSRITDSIKDVLRPSWLVASDEDVPASLEAPSGSAVDQGEEHFVSPVQSPSQLPGFGREGRLAEDGGQQQTQRRDAPGGVSVPHQPRMSGLSPWDHRAYGGRSTWGNSAAPFDKDQYARNFLGQNVPPRLPDSLQALSSRGLGGVAPAETSATSTTAAATTSSRRKLTLSDSNALVASTPQRQQGEDSRSLFGAPGSPESSSDKSEHNPTKRQRLWSPEVQRKGTPLQPPGQSKPSFKIAVFCSSNMNESVHESPFYSGKTTFGGASAYRRKSLNTSLPYQNSLPLRKSVTAKPLNNSGNAVLSTSANQILKTLERLSDAKRSKANETQNESLLSFTPSSYRRSSRPLNTSLPSRSLELPVRGPPTNRLQSPLPVSIAKNRQVISLPSSRPHQPPATATITIEDEEDDDDDDDDVVALQKQSASERQRAGDAGQEVQAPKSRNKMKRPKTYELARGGGREEDEVVEVPSLRTDFTLPIHTMPGINLSLGSAAPAFSLPSATSKPTAAPVSASRGGVAASSPPPLQYTFSSPIHKSGPDSSGSSPPAAGGFSFSSPLSLTQSVTGGSKLPSVAPSTSSFSSTFTPPAWGSLAPKPKSVTGNGQSGQSLAFGGDKLPTPVSLNTKGRNPVPAPTGPLSGGPVRAASHLKEGSVMDILGGGAGKSPSLLPTVSPDAPLKKGSVMDVLGGKVSSTPASLSSNSLLAKFAPAPGSWECDACMLQNKPEASKCIACETPKPGAKQKGQDKGPSSVSGGSLLAKFAPAPGSWECDACMLQNKPEASKCIACETAKPGAKQKGTSSVSGGSLLAKFAPAPGSWECDACMLQNKPEASKCVACETPKPGAKQKGATSQSQGGDSLLAKFAPPPGSWECDACMLQNKPEASKCIACETPKPGAKQKGSSSSGASDDLMSRLRRPKGDWECDVCMVQNPAAKTSCLACESPKPGTQSTGSAPPISFSGSAHIGARGGLVFTPASSSSSSAPSPFLVAQTPTATTQPAATGFKFAQTSAATTVAQSSAGFKFGQTSSSSASISSSLPSAGGFKFGAATSGAGANSAGSAGFKFGSQDSSNSNSASPVLSSSTPASAAGFQFGAKATSAEKDGADTKTASVAPGGFSFANPAISSAGGGLVFGGSSKAATPVTTTAQSATGSGFGLGAGTGEQGGGMFKSPGQTQSREGEGKGEDKTSAAGKEGGAAAGGGGVFMPVFGAGKPTNSFSLGAGPSLATGTSASLTTGGFQFGKPAVSDTSSASSVFGSAPSSRVTSPAKDLPTPQGLGTGSGSSKLPARPGGGFSFGGAGEPGGEGLPKAGLFASQSAPADSSSKNGPSGVGGLPAPSASQGFMFGDGGPTTTGSSAPSPFASATQAGAGGFKAAVNGEVGAPPPYAFGQTETGGSLASGGFSFAVAAKDGSGVTGNSLATGKQPFSFTDGGSAPKAASEKRHLDNDIGPGDAKKRSFNLSGDPEPFNFGNPGSVAGNSLFKFGQAEGSGGKAPGAVAFGGQASGFGTGPVGGFGLGGAQTNAASSTQAGSVFGAGGAGSSNTGQFSFSAGAGSQSNAAAASPFGSDASAPAPSQGFSFSAATQPSFNFGSSGNSSSAPSLFQFGSQVSQSAADTASAQPAPGGVFMFGQAPTADSTTPAPAFSAPAGLSFGAAPAQNNFNIGTSEGPRKIKRAVRRTRK